MADVALLCPEQASTELARLLEVAQTLLRIITCITRGLRKEVYNPSHVLTYDISKVYQSRLARASTSEQKSGASKGCVCIVQHAELTFQFVLS